MPLRMLLDEGAVAPEDVALVGARNLDPGEAEYLERTGIDDSLERAVAGVVAAYVALDLDVVDPGEAAVFMPEPGGLAVRQVEAVLRSVAVREDQRGRGLGQALVAAAEDLARERGASELILLTETAEPFFARLGYDVIDRGVVADDVAGSIEFAVACPSTAVAMRRRLA